MRVKIVCNLAFVRTLQAAGSIPDEYGTLSTELPTDYHHTSINKLSVR